MKVVLGLILCIELSVLTSCKVRSTSQASGAKGTGDDSTCPNEYPYEFGDENTSAEALLNLVNAKIAESEKADSSEQAASSDLTSAKNILKDSQSQLLKIEAATKAAKTREEVFNSLAEKNGLVLSVRKKVDAISKQITDLKKPSSDELKKMVPELEKLIAEEQKLSTGITELKFRLGVADLNYEYCKQQRDGKKLQKDGSKFLVKVENDYQIEAFRQYYPYEKSYYPLNESSRNISIHFIDEVFKQNGLKVSANSGAENFGGGLPFPDANYNVIVRNSAEPETCSAFFALNEDRRLPSGHLKIALNKKIFAETHILSVYYLGY